MLLFLSLPDFFLFRNGIRNISWNNLMGKFDDINSILYNLFCVITASILVTLHTSKLAWMTDFEYPVSDYNAYMNN